MHKQETKLFFVDRVDLLQLGCVFKQSSEHMQSIAMFKMLPYASRLSWEHGLEKISGHVASGLL